jgi:hypothetical protein
LIARVLGSISANRKGWHASTFLKEVSSFMRIRSTLRLPLLTAGFAFVVFAEPNVLAVRDTRFELDRMPFPFTGVSFFNAIYNPAFNKDSATRRRWMKKFRSYSINVFRVWAQWGVNADLPTQPQRRPSTLKMGGSGSSTSRLSSKSQAMQTNSKCALN